MGVRSGGLPGPHTPRSARVSRLATPTKFGAFAGVFTPAILTILGVIMYLRLPWIVGNAGLWNAFLIIAMAHVVSITTGLSVSSIATDKKVKAGGSYYIISRSLGLPIGGTLGIALFVGLSFSVSLYLIGFTESLLTYINGSRPSVDETRLYGSIALLTVTIVTFISTSLVIRTQFWIMALIGVSLVSFLVGAFGAEAPAEPHLAPIPEEEGGAAFFVIFGIMFPAVTGFEAGVSMSGDLKDPKASIPKGTLWAIFVGLFVYMSLAAILAFRFDGAQLADTEKSVFTEYAWIPMLVFLGIWGATISSAFGSILGAPRILQACAVDRIGPKWFAKGSGDTNEPRRALLVTFVIAWGGILIGELDAIARIVSMFFLASYAFLNIAAFIEMAASPDFRPDFRIPKWVSLAGSIVCAFLMLQLDFVAFLGATAILLLLFYLLRRKQLALEGGDTRLGIWWSLVRSGMDVLSRTTEHQRNWRPNVLLFNRRKHTTDPLRNLGLAVTETRGVMTEFQLEHVEDASINAEERRQSGADEDRPLASFEHRLEVQDPFDTMRNIARFHGMGGLEPNTVMVRWDDLSESAEDAATTLGTFQSLDYNVVVGLAPRTFAVGHRIDVWWSGEGRNLALALALVRFVTSAEAWRQAEIRFILVVADPARKRSLQTRLARWLSEARVQADKVILDAPNDGRTFEELVIKTSSTSDLTILGLRSGDNDDPTDELAELAASGLSMLAIQASRAFANPFPDISPESLLERKTLEEIGPRPPSERPKTLTLPDEDLGISEQPLTYHDAVAEALVGFHEEVFKRLSNDAAEVVDEIEAVISRAFKQLQRAVDTRPLARRQRTVTRIEAGVLTGMRVIFADFEQRYLREQQDVVLGGMTHASERLGQLAASVEETIVVTPEGEDWRTLQEKLLRRDHAVLIPLKGHVEDLLVNQVPPRVVESLERLSSARHATLDGLDGLMSWALKAVQTVAERVANMPTTEPSGDASEKASKKPTSEPSDEPKEGADGEVEAPKGPLPPAHAELEELQVRISGWRQREAVMLGQEHEKLLNTARDSAQLLSDRLGSKASRKATSAKLTASGDPFEAAEVMEQAEHRLTMQAQLLRRSVLDVTLRELHHALRGLVEETRSRLAGSVERGVLSDIDRFQADLDGYSEALKGDPLAKLELSARMDTSFDDRAAVGKLLEEVHRLASELPESVETLSDVSFEALASENFEEIEVVDVQVRRLVSFVLETDFVGALQESLGRLGTSVQASDNTVRDVLRLVSFEDRDAEEAEAADLIDERLDLVGSGKKRVDSARAEVAKSLKAAQEALGALGDEVIDRTRAAAINQKAGQLARFMRTYERQQLLSRFGNATRDLGERFRRTFIELSYRYSRTVLLAQQLRRSERAKSPPAEKLLALHRWSSPNKQVEEDLPIFYRQVFIGRAAEDPAYWMAQESEMRQARTAIAEHRKGRSGALMVTGPPGSGRNALVQRILKEEMAKDRVFVVRAPEGGSCDAGRFERALGHALGSPNDGEQTLANLPRGSCVVVRNLELWWERRPGGMAAVDRLIELVDRYGDGVLFVITCNEFFARLAGRLGRLSDQLLATVHCLPLDARQLREAVMTRHKATGMTLLISRGPRKGPTVLLSEAIEPTEWGLARIFSGLFDYSDGYIGSALRAWIAHIERIEGNTIILRRPRDLELDALDALSDDSTAMLIELTLHHQLTVDRLQRLTGLDAPAVRMAINALKREGLAVESTTGVLMLDPWMTPHVLRWFGDREVM